MHDHFRYILHPSGVHEFRHLVASHQSVDASAVALESLLAERPVHNPPPLALLSNTITSGDQPVMYAMSQYRAAVYRYEDHLGGGLYLALVHNSGAMISLWGLLFDKLHPLLSVRSFREHELDDAHNWLAAQLRHANT